MATLQIETPEILLPACERSRYKALYGGRGSMKSHFFAELAIDYAISYAPLRVLCVREIQNTLEQSSKRLLEDKIKKFKVEHMFDVQKNAIAGPGGGLFMFQGMRDHTAASIKSFENINVCWVAEGQTLSAFSWEILRPTIRAKKSEIWADWNPRDPSDAIDEFFRGPQGPPPNSVVIPLNWYDNPYFPDEMEADRQHDKKTAPHRYRHIWEGDYEPAVMDALWDYESINRNRRSEHPEMETIFVSVDHAVKDGKKTKANEHGIIVGGRGVDGRGYVLADLSMRGRPEEWGRRVISAFDLYKADGVIVETNQGGDLIRRNLETIRPNIPIWEENAGRGKHVRAAPVASLYNLGRISHVGSFPELEGQMVKMTSGKWEGPDDESPDRLDALVWLFTHIFPQMNRQDEPRQPVRMPAANGWMG